MSQNKRKIKHVNANQGILILREQKRLNKIFHEQFCSKVIDCESQCNTPSTATERDKGHCPLTFDLLGEEIPEPVLTCYSTMN